MEATASILTVGSEILDGRILDTNSKWISEQLAEHGIRTVQILTCDDKIDDITEALSYLEKTSSITIISGGLGPTTDDLTVEALAKYLGVSLELNQQVLDGLRERYRLRGREFDPKNEKQAYFPVGAEVIPNEWGTAAGSFVQTSKGHVFTSLPGVPRELKGMTTQTVLPKLLSLDIATESLHTHTFRTFGLPESTLGGMVEEALSGLDLEVSYRPTFPEVQIQLRSPSISVIEEAVALVRGAIRTDFVFSEDPTQSFAMSLHQSFLAAEIKLATAESCTGGMIGGLLTRTPGSSAYYNGGVVSYSNEAKQQMLGVSAETLERHGAVSHKTACEMASGALEKFSADYAVSVTGIAGPDGGSEEKPVGTYYIGCASKDLVASYLFFFPGTRDGVRRFAMYSALDILRRRVLNLPLVADDIIALKKIEKN